MAHLLYYVTLSNMNAIQDGDVIFLMYARENIEMNADLHSGRGRRYRNTTGSVRKPIPNQYMFFGFEMSTLV